MTSPGISALRWAVPETRGLRVSVFIFSGFGFWVLGKRCSRNGAPFKNKRLRWVSSLLGFKKHMGKGTVQELQRLLPPLQKQCREARDPREGVMKFSG